LFNVFKDWRKFACYSGIGPFEYSSGSSVRARTKVNHFADKKIKSLLHLVVLNAIKYDAELRNITNENEMKANISSWY